MKDLECHSGSLSRAHWQPPVIPKEICAGKMPLKAYIEGCRRISQHFSGDMHPDDATGNVYRWLRMHISQPPSASARMDAVSASIGKKGKVDEQISPGENGCLCAETSTEPRLCARTLQYMLCMASSVRRGVSPITPLRTGSISKAAVSGGLRHQILR